MEEILTLLPPEWLALWRTWAPVALAVILAVTGAAHVLLPIARRLQAWAKKTKNTVDDGIFRWLVVGLEWTSGGGSWLITHLPRLAAGDPRDKEPEADEDGAGRPGAGGALALALVFLVASPVLAGCGPAAFELHVQFAAAADDTAQETRDLVRAYRVDSMRAAARAVFETGAPMEEVIQAAVTRSAELEPLVEGQRLYALAAHGYVAALKAEAGDFGTAGAKRALGILLDAYRHLRQLGEDLGLGALAGLPETPSWLDDLLPPHFLAEQVQR